MIDDTVMQRFHIAKKALIPLRCRERPLPTRRNVLFNVTRDNVGHCGLRIFRSPALKQHLGKRAFRFTFGLEPLGPLANALAGLIARDVENRVPKAAFLRNCSLAAMPTRHAVVARASEQISGQRTYRPTNRSNTHIKQ